VSDWAAARAGRMVASTVVETREVRMMKMLEKMISECSMWSVGGLEYLLMSTQRSRCVENGKQSVVWRTKSKGGRVEIEIYNSTW
jgi:hypothetical protein